MDALRLEWTTGKDGEVACVGGRTVLGCSELDDDAFCVAIDDEAFLRIRGRVPFGCESEPGHEYNFLGPGSRATTPFTDEAARRAVYVRERRRSRTIENATLRHAHLVASGRTHSVVVGGDGTAYKLWHGEARDDALLLSPLRMHPTPYVVRVVAAGWADFLLLSEAGALYACAVDEDTPRAVDALIGVRIRAIACGSEHFAAASDGGDCYTWGKGAAGRLGHGDEDDVPRPKLVDALATSNVCAVGGGLAHTLALCCDANGKHGAITMAFGEGKHGKLGVGDSEDRLRPARVRMNGVSSLSLGHQHTLLVDDRGDCFGHGCGYRNGHPDHADLPFPRRIPGLRGVDVVAVAAGRYRSFAAAKDGRVYAWGGDRAARRKSKPAPDEHLRVACDVCHVCRRRDHVARAPRLLSEASRLQAREEEPFWPFARPIRVVDPEFDEDIPPDTDECNYPAQPVVMEMVAHHEPYVVDVVVAVKRDAGFPGAPDDASEFFRSNIRQLKWRVDPFDSRTLILTRHARSHGDPPPVDDAFTFKERGRAADWCFVLDQWYVWEPL